MTTFSTSYQKHILGDGAATTAILNIGASTTAMAPLNVASGVAPTTPNDGDYWYDGTHLNFRIGATTYQIDNQTGFASPMTTQGDLIYGGTSGVATRLAAGASTTVLLGGTTPSWGQVNLSNQVWNTLPVVNGGSGATTLTGILKGNGTGAFSAAVVGTDYLAPSGNGSALTGITESQVTNLTSDLALKAPLASPTFTGTLSAAAITATGIITSTNNSGNIFVAPNFQMATGSGFFEIQTFSSKVLALNDQGNSVAVGKTSATSTFDVNGSLSLTTVTKTANYTLTAADHTVRADATSGNITQTLPTAVGITGRIYVVKKIDASANTVTIATTSSQTIDGATTVVISSQYESFMVQSNGTNWDITNLVSDLANKPSKTTANTYTAGMKQTVSHDATNAGFNLGNVTGDPSGALEGDVWYNSSTDTVLYRAGASTQTFAVTDAAQTFANKRITRRAPVVTQSATPAINTDVTDVAHITGLAQAITSMTSSLTGTPVEGDQLRIDITDNGTAHAITWGASFESSTASLPTTTVVSTRLDIMFVWNSVTSKWRCLAVA